MEYEFGLYYRRNAHFGATIYIWRVAVSFAKALRLRFFQVSAADGVIRPQGIVLN